MLTFHAASVLCIWVLFTPLLVWLDYKENKWQLSFVAFVLLFHSKHNNEFCYTGSFPCP